MAPMHPKKNFALASKWTPCDFGASWVDLRGLKPVYRTAVDAPQQSHVVIPPGGV